MAPKILRQQLEAADASTSASSTTPKSTTGATIPFNGPFIARRPKDEVFGDMTKEQKTRLLTGDPLLITYVSEGDKKTMIKPRRMVIKFSKFAREQLPRPEFPKPETKGKDLQVARSKTAQPATLNLPDEKVYENALLHVFQWMEECCETGKGTPLAATEDLTMNVRILQVIQTLGIYGCEHRFLSAIKAYISNNFMAKKDVQCIWAEFPEDELMINHLVHNITYSKVFHSEDWEECEAVTEYINSREGLYEMVEEKSVKLLEIDAKKRAWEKRQECEKKNAESRAKRDEYLAMKEQKRRDRLADARDGLVALTEREVRWGVGL